MKTLQEIFENAKKRIGAELHPEQKGEYDMNDMYILAKDLAHTGGTNATTPISIMPKGTIFYRRIASGYYSDGFHLIGEHVAQSYPEYFQKFNP